MGDFFSSRVVLIWNEYLAGKGNSNKNFDIRKMTLSIYLQKNPVFD